MNYTQKKTPRGAATHTQGNNITNHIIPQTNESVKHKPHQPLSAYPTLAGGGWLWKGD